MVRGVCNKWQNNTRRLIVMIEIDTNEQFIVYAIHNNCGRWYVTDKEIWYLDYKKK